MGPVKGVNRRSWVLGVLLACVVARSAAAIYLDDEQQISLRTRIYSQATLRTQDTSGDTTPPSAPGQLIQHRNFYNPELEAKLVSYLSWMKGSGMSFLAPDSLDFRLAGWGFYDGLYDYGTQQFDQARKQLKARFSQADSVDDVVKGTDNVVHARDIYAHQNRVNELYLSYSKGPFFLRVGRQAISWGESDTIGILDQNNPFDLTLGIPGIFEDLDEARIPLWTVRTSYSLFDQLGPLSSGFLEAYWVPGDIDTTTAYIGILTVSPYSTPGIDPAATTKSFCAVSSKLCAAQFVLLDHTPAETTGNSRYGVRTQAVVARDYTVSAWFYTTFPNAPVPRMVGLVTSTQAVPGKSTDLLITEIVHKLTPVFGVSNTFFFQPMNGIIRMEAEYFNREPAFIPSANLLVPQTSNLTQLLQGCKNARGNPVVCRDQVPRGADLPRASFLRWELGYDRFFFFRPLNPTNSFTWVTAFVGSYNMDETSKKDFYFQGQTKPHGSAQENAGYVQLQKVDNMFVQTHLTTDYMHGRLAPAITVIANAIGATVVQPTVEYRGSDSLLLDLNYTVLTGAFTGTGFFRDRDQLAARMTYQLN